MRSTLRFRLTTWYVGALAAILVVFSLGVYSLLRKNLLQRLDSTLRSAAQVSTMSLHHEIEEHGGKVDGEASVRAVLSTMQQTSFPRTAISIWDGDRLVAEKPGTNGISAETIHQSISTAEKESDFKTFTFVRKPYRAVRTAAFVQSASTWYQVIAVESMEPVLAELATLREVLWVTVPVCLLLAAVGGYFLARKSVAPMFAMATTADQISSRSLNRRLDVINPNDELGYLAATFNRLFARLEETFDQQRRFMTDASHELRTPLSVALTATQVSLTPQPGDVRAEEMRDALTVIQQQLLRLRRVVEDMFMLAQAENGTYIPTITTFYLNEVIDESARAAEVLGSVRHVRVCRVEAAPEILYVGDEGLLRQLFLILLDNAVKYSPRDGNVFIQVTRAEDRVIVTIQDEGCGVPEFARDHIFERFFRVDKARSRDADGLGSGAGLGLAIAQWIASLHAGVVRLDSSTSAGSSFSVELPLSPDLSPVSPRAAPVTG